MIISVGAVTARLSEGCFESAIQAETLKFPLAHFVLVPALKENPRGIRLITQGEITACKFDPSGQTLAACSVDRSICERAHGGFFTLAHVTALWKTYPPHENYGILPNIHKQAILDIAYSLDSEVIYSGGADGMLIATDLRSGQRIARYSAHFGPLNSIAVAISGGRELVLTGGDDGIARVWDLSMDTKEAVVEFDDGRDCPVTAVEWSRDGNQCFVGGVDNEVKVGLGSLAEWTGADDRGLGSENE